jgi:hypothetical protein
MNNCGSRYKASTATVTNGMNDAIAALQDSGGRYCAGSCEGKRPLSMEASSCRQKPVERCACSSCRTCLTRSKAHHDAKISVIAWSGTGSNQPKYGNRWILPISCINELVLSLQRATPLEWTIQRLVVQKVASIWQKGDV